MVCCGTRRRARTGSRLLLAAACRVATGAGDIGGRASQWYLLPAPNRWSHWRLHGRHDSALRDRHLRVWSVDAMKPCILLRHGETEMAGLFCGHSDPPLSDAGREQIELAASMLDEPPKLI